MTPRLKAMPEEALRRYIIVLLRLSRTLVDSGLFLVVGIGLSHLAAAFAFASAAAMLMVVAATVAQALAHQGRRCRCCR